MGTYVAPSWSWPSVSGFVEWGITFDKKVQPLVKVIEVHTEPVGSDVFGQLSGELLRLQGSLLWDNVFLPHIANERLSSYMLEKSAGSITPDDKSLDLNSLLLLIPVAFRYLTDVGLDENAAVQGIVLMIKSMNQGGRPFYHRAGHFNISKNISSGENLHDALIEATKQDSGRFHYDQEIEVEGRKEYIITIF